VLLPERMEIIQATKYSEDAAEGLFFKYKAKNKGFSFRSASGLIIACRGN